MTQTAPKPVVGPSQPVEVSAQAPGTPAPAEAGPTPFFFSGARRSGTTWLAAMLNAHPQVECRNEGWMFNNLGASFPEWIDETKVRAWAARREAQGTWLRDQTIDEALRAMRRAVWLALTRLAVEREGWKAWSNLRYLGDKTTVHFCTHADAIHRTFPDARFLHMLRDGRDVVVSDVFLLLRELEDLDVPEDVRREAVDSRRFHVFGRGRPVPLLQPGVMRYAVDGWARCIAGARRARELFGRDGGAGGGFHEVRYERLVANPAEEVAAIFRWLGVETDGAFVEHLATTYTFERLSGGRRPGQEDRTAEWRKGVIGDWRNHFTNDDKALFKSLAGELLVELGYEPDLSW